MAKNVNTDDRPGVWTDRLGGGCRVNRAKRQLDVDKNRPKSGIDDGLHKRRTYDRRHKHVTRTAQLANILQGQIKRRVRVADQHRSLAAGEACQLPFERTDVHRCALFDAACIDMRATSLTVTPAISSSCCFAKSASAPRLDRSAEKENA